MEGETVVSAMTNLLSTLGEVFTFLIGKVGQVLTVITENPIALIPVGVVLAYTIVKFALRILGIR